MVDATAAERVEESRAALERVRHFALRVCRMCAYASAAQALASRELEGAPLLLLANKLDIAGTPRNARFSTARLNALTRAHTQARTAWRRWRRRSHR